MPHKLKSPHEYYFRVPYGHDLADGILRFCRKNDISAGMVLCIGAVQGATLGYYHQKQKEYEWHREEGPLEIVSGIGNVSLKNGQTFLHLHVSLADSRGRVCGGHLSSPTPVFACEVYVRTANQGLTRKYDRRTGLFLW